MQEELFLDLIVIIMGLVQIIVKVIHAKTAFGFKVSPLVPLPAATQLDYWDFTSEFPQVNVEKVPSELCWPDYSLTNQQNKGKQV